MHRTSGLFRLNQLIFFSSRRRHTRWPRDWSSDVCSSDLDQTLERKAQEAWLALQLERELSKEQIMTYYLNRIHMGGNVYEIGRASCRERVESWVDVVAERRTGTSRVARHNMGDSQEQ